MRYLEQKTLFNLFVTDETVFFTSRRRKDASLGELFMLD